MLGRHKEDVIINIDSPQEGAPLLDGETPATGYAASKPANDTILEVGNAPGEAHEDDPLHEAQAEETSKLAKVGVIAKYLGIYLLAAIAAAPSALSAFVAPSGQGPEKIGEEWWKAMSLFKQIHSVASGVSSEIVNTIMNALFIPVAWEKVRASLADMKNGLPQVIKSSLSLLLGVGAGVALGAIAYGSFLWLPVSALAFIPTVISFGITFAGRFISIRNIFTRVSNLFNADIRLQKVLADKLEHVNEAYVGQLNERINTTIDTLFPEINKDEPLTPEQYEAVIIELAREMDQLEQQFANVVNDATWRELALKYTGLVIDIITAVSILSPAFMTFTQKGFDGVNILSKLISNAPLDDIHPAAKAAIGLTSGAASAIFYANAGIDFRANLGKTISHVYNHPAHIPAAVGLVAVNAIACNSMTSVAQGVVHNPHNIFGLHDGAYGASFVGAQTAGGLIVNLNSCLLKTFAGADPLPAASDVSVAHISSYLKSDDHVIKAGALRQFSIYPPHQNDTSVQYQHLPPANDVVLDMQGLN